MKIDLKTGITLWQAYKFLKEIIEANWDNIRAYRDDLRANYELDDDELEALMQKEKYGPEDMPTIARVCAQDYNLKRADKLPDDFNNNLIQTFNNICNMYKKFKPQQPQQTQPQEVPNAGTN